MSEKNTGGSAFPSHGSMGEVAQEGMTLRDYFAAKAMQSHAVTAVNITASGGPNAWCDKVAQESYRLADAMLKAREA